MRDYYYDYYRSEQKKMENRKAEAVAEAENALKAFYFSAGLCVCVSLFLWSSKMLACASCFIRLGGGWVCMCVCKRIIKLWFFRRSAYRFFHLVCMPDKTMVSEKRARKMWQFGEDVILHYLINCLMSHHRCSRMDANANVECLLSGKCKTKATVIMELSLAHHRRACWKMEI